MPKKALGKVRCPFCENLIVIFRGEIPGKSQDKTPPNAKLLEGGP